MVGAAHVDGKSVDSGRPMSSRGAGRAGLTSKRSSLTTRRTRTIWAAPWPSRGYDRRGIDGQRQRRHGKGAAYVFTRSRTRWAQQKLVADDAADKDDFGHSVAISEDTIVVGSILDDDEAVGAGSAYVFTRSGASWAQRAKLTASDPMLGGRFGGSVAVSGKRIVVGSTMSSGLKSGTAYVFEPSGAGWAQQAKLLSTGKQPKDVFGSDVAMWGDTIAVAAAYDSQVGSNSGAVHVFVHRLSDGGSSMEASEGEKSHYTCATAPGRGAGSGVESFVAAALALAARSRRRRRAARP